MGCLLWMQNVIVLLSLCVQYCPMVCLTIPEKGRVNPFVPSPDCGFAITMDFISYYCITLRLKLTVFLRMAESPSRLRCPRDRVNLLRTAVQLARSTGLAIFDRLFGVSLGYRVQHVQASG